MELNSTTQHRQWGLTPVHHSHLKCCLSGTEPSALKLNGSCSMLNDTGRVAVVPLSSGGLLSVSHSERRTAAHTFTPQTTGIINVRLVGQIWPDSRPMNYWSDTLWEWWRWTTLHSLYWWTQRRASSPWMVSDRRQQQWAAASHSENPWSDITHRVIHSPVDPLGTIKGVMIFVWW